MFAINGFHEQHLDTQRETLTNLIECYYCRFVDGDVDERCTYFQKVLTFAHTIRCKVKYDKTIRKLLVIMKERNRVFEALTVTYQMESTDSRMENCLSELLMLVNDIKQCTRRLKADGIEQIPDAKHMSESTDVKPTCGTLMMA